MDKQTITTHPTLEDFPSLPQVLIRLLEAIGDDTADFSHISSIVEQDPASAARLIQIANASFYRRHTSCNNVKDALSLLGLETVKTLVITASIRQYFSQFSLHHHEFLQQFWHRSMVIAHSARVLATLTRYPSATEAYLCGLLCDTGQLYLITGHPETYARVLKEAGGDDSALLIAERQALGMDHCQAGAALLEQWQLGTFMADAVRYHHEPATTIADSHHLVKLINMASALSGPGGPMSEGALSNAQLLFGLTEELVEELFQRISREVRETAESLGISMEAGNGQEQARKAHDQLGQVIEQVSQHRAMQGMLGTATPPSRQSPLAPRTNRALYLGLGVDRYVLFLHDADENTLKGFTQPGTTVADFSIDSSMPHSLVARCFRDGKPVATEKEPGTLETITDQQLMRYCQQGRLLCMPFHSAGRSGVLVTGLQSSAPEPLTRPTLWRNLMADIVPLFNVDATEESETGQQDVNTRRIRETLHEISNPLTIISNYLEMLRLRLEGQDGAGQEIDVLKEEMDRISEILLRLRDPDTPAPERIININTLISDHARLLEQSICVTKRIQVITRLDEKMPPLPVDAVGLKQVVTNLTRNAVEAMGEDGVLRLTSRANVVVNGRRHAAIDIEDNGPGLPEGIMDAMLQDRVSTKGGTHSGLGLPIANQLIKSMDGQMLCSSDKGGTTFTLLLPIRQPTQRNQS